MMAENFVPSNRIPCVHTDGDYISVNRIGENVGIICAERAVGGMVYLGKQGCRDVIKAIRRELGEDEGADRTLSSEDIEEIKTLIKVAQELQLWAQELRLCAQDGTFDSDVSANSKHLTKAKLVEIAVIKVNEILK